MKHSILFTVVAAGIMLAGCSSDEVVDISTQNAIGFKAMANKSSRAEVNTTNLNRFRVYGCTMDKGSTNNHTTIFTEQLVSKSDGALAWTYSPLQYWAVNKDYYFVAVSSNIDARKWSFSVPATHDGNLTVDNFKGYGTLNFDNQAAGGESDLVYAYSARSTSESVQTEGKVEFTFNHMLSRIIFNFKNGIESNTYTFSISNLKIGNVISSGEVSLGADNLAWISKGEKATLTLEIAPDKVSSTEQTGYITNLNTRSYFIIPGESQELTVGFTVKVYLNGQLYATHERTGKISAKDYEPAKSYMFTTTLTAENISSEEVKPIEFDVKNVNTWPENESSDVTLN